MRPSVSVPDSEQYECLDCGERVSDPDDRVCPDCGGSLRDLSLSRDF